jgi:hypothetical protein
VLASPLFTDDGLRWSLEPFLIFTVGGFFLEVALFDEPERNGSNTAFCVLFVAYSGIGIFAFFVWFAQLEAKYHSEGIELALFTTTYTVLFEFGVILIYYKFAYQEVGTYKPAWLDWLG